MTPADLIRFRERLGWTQSRLAEALGIPTNTLARWERGELLIRHPTILRLALERLRSGEA